MAKLSQEINLFVPQGGGSGLHQQPDNLGFKERPEAVLVRGTGIRPQLRQFEDEASGQAQQLRKG